MNPEIKKLWIEALRSGEFQQGLRQLECDGKYCCLGVLELLAFRAGVVSKFRGERPYLSTEVAEWAGLPSTNPRLADGLGMWAGSLNDHGETFAEIADRIEKYL